MDKPSAIIIGAGTAGLAAHLALRRAGFEVQHFERKESVEERGGNLAMWPNGGRILDLFGAGAGLKSVGCAPAGFSIYDPDGAPVSRVEFGPIAELMGMPMYMTPRAHFQGMLFDAVGRDQVHMGKACVSVEQDGSSVTATFADDHRATADVLVACDGVRSPIRRSILHEVAQRYVGVTIWTGWMKDQGFRAEYSPNPDSMVEYWGAGQRIAIAPTGDGYTGFTFIMRVEEDVAVDDPHAWLSGLFAGYPPMIGKLFDRLDSEELVRWPVYDIPPLERWSSGRIVLMGDSAHAASPTLGQGAGMAVEDAYVLAQCLADADRPVPERLAAFEAQRRERCEMIVTESRLRSIASTEPDPERLKVAQEAVRNGEPWTVLKNIMDIVAGGPVQ